MKLTEKHTQDIEYINCLLASRLDGIELDCHIKNRPDGEFLIIELCSPNNNLTALISEINRDLDNDNLFKDRIAIVKRQKTPTNKLELPETKLLRREISESLTVDKDTFGDDFLNRYTRSVSNLEELVIANANSVIYGRRGAGKSSLLAYAMHTIKKNDGNFCWISMQTYSQRGEWQVVSSVLGELARGVKFFLPHDIELNALIDKFNAIEISNEESTTIKSAILRMVPLFRRLLGSIASRKNPFTIFLDDFHLIDTSLQPVLLGTIYSLSRGNSVFIKLSGIEQLCNLWDTKTHQGFQIPHDAQVLKLDHNLTMPNKSLVHIFGILDGHAKYCGLPSIRYIIDDQALSRLVLVAAAVPRDALGLFSQSISKAIIKSQKKITVTAINAAASDAALIKIQEIHQDVSAEETNLLDLLTEIKNFCIMDKKINSFLVKIDQSNQKYINLQKLVALRLIHMLHEGITRSRAGEGYQALMLDFGFYVGIRTARSVDIFPNELKQLAAKDLRGLPVLHI